MEMLALTAIVFSLVIVMIQFSAIAYSPFLVIWTTRDRVLNFLLLLRVGVFIAFVGIVAVSVEASI
jgi:hypothetical protein